MESPTNGNDPERTPQRNLKEEEEYTMENMSPKIDPSQPEFTTPVKSTLPQKVPVEDKLNAIYNDLVMLMSICRDEESCFLHATDDKHVREEIKEQL